MQLTGWPGKKTINMIGRTYNRKEGHKRDRRDEGGRGMRDLQQIGGTYNR